MESQLVQSRNTQSTLQLLHSRTLCAVCGAPAIGNRKKNERRVLFQSIFVNFSYLGRNFDAMTCLSCKGMYVQ